MTTFVSDVAKVLKADTKLMNMLPANKPYSGDGAAARKYSIIPAGNASGKTVTPFITLQAGSRNAVDENAVNELIYIRVYDKEQYGVAHIAKILDRVKTLLHNKPLALDRGIEVKIKYEGGLAELRDDSVQAHFVEDQYRLLSL